MTRRRATALDPTSLRAAFAPHLEELNGCHCPVCRAVDDQRLFIGGQDTLRDPVAYWAAVSTQLRAATEGTHRRVPWSEYIATLPPASYRAAPSVGAMGALGLGIGPRLRNYYDRDPA